jgi:diguanylate cyclase (GGDEF)-like protein/PAS domain S-box-containing protein
MDKDYYKFIIDNARDFITLIDSNYTYVFTNDKYAEAVGKRREELIGARVEEVWGREKFESTIKGYFDRCFSGEEVHYVEEFKFGPFLKYMHVSYYPYEEEEGEITHVAVFSHDITHVGRLESKLNHYEYRDPLTGLFNRRSLNAIMDKELERARRFENESVRILLFIELNRMENIVEMYGQEVYDLLLENTGMRIQDTLRTSDYVFRFEGNQFAVLLTHVNDKFDAGRVASKIYDNVTFPYHFRGNDIGVKCNVGTVVYPDDGVEKEDLIQKAASAMLEARRRERGFVLYNAQTHSEAIERLEIEGCTQKALEDQQFELYYQPIVGKDFRIIGAEALLRWNHPDRGFVSPGDFIPIVEQTELIFPIGSWVLYTVCGRLREWGPRHGIFVTINVSGKEFSSEDIVTRVENAVAVGKETEINPRYLKLEITETECVRNIEESVLHIRDINRLGVEVFIDDFGTGNSSLQYLHNLPAEVLKIDQSFIAEIEKDREQLDFLDHLVNMVKSRRKNVLIEGVETERQASLLAEMGCDFFQGYYFCKPVSAAEFERLLRIDAVLGSEGSFTRAGH